jgi:hypothetical protein
LACSRMYLRMKKPAPTNCRWTGQRRYAPDEQAECDRRAIARFARTGRVSGFPGL